MLLLWRRPWLRLSLVALVLLTIQTTLCTDMKPFGQTVDLMLLVSSVAGLVGGPQSGALSGFVFGIAFDLVLVSPFGMSSLTYGLIGFAVGYSQTFTIDPTWYLCSGVTALAGAAGVLLLAILEQILGPKGPFPKDMVASMLVMGVTGGVIGPIVMPVQRWCLGIKRKIV
jgi:rod shape-determining protein MreD